MEYENRYECQNCGSLLRECELPPVIPDDRRGLSCPNCGQGPLKQVKQIALPFGLRMAPA